VIEALDDPVKGNNMKLTTWMRGSVTGTILALAAPGDLRAQTKPIPDPPAPATGSATSTSEQPAAPRSSSVNGVNRTPWFGTPKVRDQLQINDDQYNRLNRSYQTSWTRFNDGLSNLDSALSPEERQQREMQLRSRFTKDFSPTVHAVFPDAAARHRYDQLYLQYRGYGAFSEPTVVEKLNLTDDQRQRMSDYDRDWNQRMSGWIQTYPADPDKFASQYNESRQEIQTRIHATLTPEQRQTWQDLSGRPHEFPHDVYLPDTASSRPVLK
jgi:hypothetical protein